MINLQIDENDLKDIIKCLNFHDEETGDYHADIIEKLALALEKPPSLEKKTVLEFYTVLCEILIQNIEDLHGIEQRNHPLLGKYRNELVAVRDVINEMRFDS